MKPEEIKPTKVFPETYYKGKNPAKSSREKTEKKLAKAAKKIKTSYVKTPWGYIFLPPGTTVGEEFYNLVENLIEIKNYTLSIEERKKIIKSLALLDADILKHMANKGLKIVVVDSKKLPENWVKGKDKTGKYVPAYAYYNYPTNEIVVRNDRLTRSVLLHEAGHAFSDFLSDDKKAIFLSDIENTKLQKLFQAYIKRCQEAEYKYNERVKKWEKNGKIGPKPESESNAKWSWYARVNVEDPDEYFAEAFMFYFTSSKTRKTLREADPDMYNYIANEEYKQDLLK